MNTITVKVIVTRNIITNIKHAVTQPLKLSCPLKLPKYTLTERADEYRTLGLGERGDTTTTRIKLNVAHSSGLLSISGVHKGSFSCDVARMITLTQPTTH
jgi:hypothetical protein